MIIEREKVYDFVLRSIHAWNALAIVLLLLVGRVAEWLGYTPDAASLRHFHVLLGYGLVLGLVARFTWGLVGPVHAGFAAMWRPRAWWRVLRTRELSSDAPDWGPRAAALYLVFYLLLFAMAVTGLALAAIDQGSGPLYLWLGHEVTLKHLFREPHAWMAHAVPVFVVVHVALLITHEIRHGVPLAQAMLSGFQYRKLDQDEE